MLLKFRCQVVKNLSAEKPYQCFQNQNCFIRSPSKENKVMLRQ